MEVIVVLSGNLRAVLNAFGIAGNRLARYLDYDPSYISRILAGTRRPADLSAFASGVATYVARNFCTDDGAAKASLLTGMPADELREPAALENAIRAFLLSEDEEPTADPMNEFLEKLDEFDLNLFMREIKFDELKVPTAPFQLPVSRTYSGIEQMKQAELDFLKAAVTSRSTEDVILYSDMPLGDMSADSEFPKKVMMGMALLIRKGVHLHNIHDVHRPLQELLMGLEGWIPVYMTGQVSPYYLAQPTNQTFLHFVRSAGTVALMGEAIAGNQGGGRYSLSNNAGDVGYVRQRARELLAHAKPLMRIFRADQALELRLLLERLDEKARAEMLQSGAKPQADGPQGGGGSRADGPQGDGESRADGPQGGGKPQADGLRGGGEPQADAKTQDELLRVCENPQKELSQAHGNPQDGLLRVGEGTFANMRITVRPGFYALIEKTNAPQVSFLVEYPALVDALAHFEPTLF